MVSMGYEVYQKEGIVFIKHGGKVQRQIPLAEGRAAFQKRLQGTRPLPPAAEHLQKIPGRERQQRRVAERAERKVRHQSRFLRQERRSLRLHDCRPRPPHRHQRGEGAGHGRTAGLRHPGATLRTHRGLHRPAAHPQSEITQGEIFQKLRKQRAYIKKGVIHFDGRHARLKPFMAEAIDRNNRIRIIEMFHPVTEAERDLLCKIFKVSRPRPGGIVRRQAAIPHGCRQPPA